jgi:predicted nuclease of predicted toxin-antitoxin system
VKFLVDENLPPSLAVMLEALYPGSAHVRYLGLEGTKDPPLWELAKKDGYAILTKDSDFEQRSFLHGAPPKVVWLKVGNSSAAQIRALVSMHLAAIESFVRDGETAIMTIPIR